MPIALVPALGAAAVAAAPAGETRPSPPDPAAMRAADANLESVEHRRGLVFGAALGPSVTIGGGTGTGGDVSLKVGHVATPSTVITFVLGGSAQFHKLPGSGELIANNFTYALAGFQYWVGPSLWISLGAGAGNYHCNQCINEVSKPETTKRAGVAGGVAAGVDLVRFKGAVLGFEVYGVSLLDRDGFVETLGSGLSLSFD